MKPGRNYPCSCGSGKKYKHCCEGKIASRTPMPSPAEIDPLIALYNTGRFAELESRARMLVGQYPDFGFGWKLFGGALQMQGKNALPAFQKASELMPNEPDAHYNLGVALKSLGLLADAAASYRRALKIKPDYAEAHSNLGNVLKDLGQLDDAVPSYRRALQLKPDSADAHNSLGAALKDLGQLDDAVASYRQALALKPDYADAHYNLGNVLKELGQLDAAVTSYRRAIEIKPDFADAYNNLGAALQELGQLDEAVSNYLRAIESQPNYAEANFNLGVVQHELGQLDAAVASYRRALEIKPDHAEAHCSLGVVQKELGQLDSALASYRRAVEIKPDFAEVHINMGAILLEQVRLAEAEASYHRALKIKPGSAEAHFNLGVVLKNLGQLDAAEASYRRALEIKPDCIEAYSNLLYMHAFTRNISPARELSLAASWENIILNKSERTAASNRTLLFDDSLAHSPRAGRKLRIGMVSAELGQHAVAEFLEPILEQLDRSRFHVTLFPTITKPGSRAARLRDLADEFKPLVGMPDNKAADLIRADRIDILIDTTAHMEGCRLGIFAHRAAPVQCHYIGYHGSTGLTEMDWFIADEVLLPSSCDTHFREGIWRLPRLWIAYRGDASLPDSRWEPSVDGTVWLGSFNNLTKVREETLALWAKVMNAIPESRLFLKDRQSINPSVQERIRMGLYRHGISAERVEFAGHVHDWVSHMSLYDKLDIALDTIPLNSGTTAFDALWMGVPLVALEGNWMGARMSSTILKALGKPEWVAQNEDEYVAIVAALARDVEGRKSLRVAQRTLVADSPLCDAKGLTRALEDAFEKMFDRWMEQRESVRKESGTK